MNRPFLLFAMAVAITSLLTLPAHSQVLPEDHEKHHPKLTTIPPVGPKTGMMEHGAAPKELYPALMDFPDLSPEQREEIQKQAQGRMISGLSMMSEALDKLAKATESDDYAGMQEATALMREGFARYESGLAAQRALAEGKSPRNVASQWFKREMNLTSPQPSEPASGPFGLSWFHFFIMVILIGFAVIMIWMYFHKMRRASELLKRLTSGSPAGGTASAAPSAPVPVSSTAAPDGHG